MPMVRMMSQMFILLLDTHYVHGENDVPNVHVLLDTHNVYGENDVPNVHVLLDAHYVNGENYTLVA
jgi:hypothetical protein